MGGNGHPHFWTLPIVLDQLFLIQLPLAPRSPTVGPTFLGPRKKPEYLIAPSQLTYYAASVGIRSHSNFDGLAKTIFFQLWIFWTLTPELMAETTTFGFQEAEISTGEAATKSSARRSWCNCWCCRYSCWCWCNCRCHWCNGHCWCTCRCCHFNCCCCSCYRSPKNARRAGRPRCRAGQSAPGGSSSMLGTA